jgi:hypothetical protein
MLAFSKPEEFNEKLDFPEPLRGLFGWRCSVKGLLMNVSFDLSRVVL